MSNYIRNLGYVTLLVGNREIIYHGTKIALECVFRLALEGFMSAGYYLISPSEDKNRRRKKNYNLTKDHTCNCAHCSINHPENQPENPPKPT